VIGALAGGVFVFLKLAAALPAEFPPIFTSCSTSVRTAASLPELVPRSGPNRAVAASDGRRAGCRNYLHCPGGHDMLLDVHWLPPVSRAKENHARPAIDPLFRSKALRSVPG
jgi:two-component system chemotaxis response regulator CheB